MIRTNLLLFSVFLLAVCSVAFAVDPAIKANPSGFADRVKAGNEPGYAAVTRGPTRVDWGSAKPSDHPDIVLYRIRWFNGGWDAWMIPGDGDLDTKFPDKQKWIYFEDHEHEIIRQVAIMIPGIPAAPGTNASTSANLQGSRNGSDSISGLQLIEEDKEYTWRGVGNSPVTIAPDTLVEYRFDFSDPHDPSPYSGSIDPFKTSDLSAAIIGKHKFKESGDKYAIYLTINYTERTATGNGSFLDEKKCRIAGPLNVVVVDHLPDYLGNVFAIIDGPGNMTGKKIPVKKYEDVIFEDPRLNEVAFDLVCYFKFYSELPPGTDTAGQTDRWGGVDPSSVSYTLSFGESVDFSGPFEIESVKNHDPLSSGPQSTTIHKCPLNGFAYNEPGLYRITVMLSFQEVEWEPVSTDGISFTYNKKLTEVKTRKVERTVRVIDRTPPRFTAQEIKAFSGTTGDLLELGFYVEDNNALKKLSSAAVFVEDFRDPEKFVSYPLSIGAQLPSSSPGFGYRLSARVPMPEDFAHKLDSESKSLRYYLQVVDGEGNTNCGMTSIIENDPPHYGADSKMQFGEVSIRDNDPPSIRITILYNDKKVFSKSFQECVKDGFGNGFLEYGKLTVTDLILSHESFASDPETNPLHPKAMQTGITLKDTLIQVQEDKRFNLIVESHDNVDKDKAGEIAYEFDSGETAEASENKLSAFLIFKEPGDHELEIRASDKPNHDHTVSKRKILIPFKVADSFFTTNSMSVHK